MNYNSGCRGGARRQTGYTKSFISSLMCLCIVVVPGLLSSNAIAETMHCSFELNDAKRELCFQSNPQQLHEQGRPGWPILNFQSYATSEPRASALRAAEGQIMCDNTETSISIGVHCADEGMKVVFATGCSIGKPYTPLPIEINAGGKSSVWKAKINRNQLGMSIDDSLQARRFMQSMKGYNSAVLVFSPKDAPKFAATYTLKGYDKAIDHLEKLCPI